MIVAATGLAKGPHIDWAGLSPLIALLGGATVVLMLGLARSRFIREQAVPFLALASAGASMGLAIWQLDKTKDLVAHALRLDGLSTTLALIFATSTVIAVLLSWRHVAPRESAHGEFYSLLLTSSAGMLTLAWAQNTITLFVGLELLSLPLYVLCATEMRRASSLEAGLKYLIVGSVGSATLLYGLALIYGATGQTGYTLIARSLANSGTANDALTLTGIAFVVVGLCFKASIAPFHQWTPDVYQGAPTPISGFMGIATKAAAFGVLLRFFDVALIDTQIDWGPALAVLASISIVVGNVGALGQSSLKRMMAYSSVGQAGYLLAGVVVSTRLGVQATVLYLTIYLAMNLCAFAVIAARERETGLGDDISAFAGIASSRPALAYPMTLSMLALAGLPLTAGFWGKFRLIEAAVDGSYAWLGLMIVIGSMISLGYYMRVIAAMWVSEEPAGARLPALAGASVELDAAVGAGAPPRGRAWEIEAVAVALGAAILFFGFYPEPLFELVARAGTAFANLT